MQNNCGLRNLSKESNMRAHPHTRKSWKRLLWKWTSTSNQNYRKCFLDRASNQ